MTRSLLALFGVLAVPCLLVPACSAGSSGTPYGGGAQAGSGPSGGSAGDASVVPESGPAGAGGTHIGVDVTNWDVPLSDSDTCNGLTVAAEPYPLDMYVMMDQSGSMGAPVGVSLKTQWVLIKNAFTQFLQASPSTGLSMGIQYFPLPIVPWEQVPTCSSQTCGSGKQCVGLDNGEHCMDNCSGGSCDFPSECLSSDTDAGSLEYCSNDSCDSAVYAKPEVEIGELPGNSAAIIASIDKHSPLTMTPSAPALAGAIAHAKEWAAAHTDRTTVVVFATDGMPTVCTEGAGFPINKVKEIAQQGVQGNPSIRTFVIGVGMAAGNLHGVAAAGGTEKALMVQANANMTQEFAQALDSIRGAMMECEFKIPQAGTLQDFDQVNVEYEATDSAKTTVYYVGELSQCDPNTGGWYYNTDPSVTPPDKILLCPQVCDYIHKNGGKIHVVIGCKTVRPPR